MKPIIVFGIGILIYYLVARHDKWFVIATIISSILFIAGGLLFPRISNELLRSLLLGLYFIIASLFPSYWLPESLPDKSDDKSGSKTKKMSFGIRIIDFSWICILGVTLSMVTLAAEISPFVKIIKLDGTSLEYHKELLGLITFHMGLFVDFIQVLGGILAASMAILWAGEIWRKGGQDLEQ